MKNKLFYLALSILWISQFFSHDAFSQNTVVRVEPATVTSPRIGQQFTVDIVIENGQNVAGYQMMLHFEYPAIELIEIQRGDYLPADAFFGRQHFLGGHGTVLLAATASPHERSGDGTLATLIFKINEVKASTFRLSAGDPSKPRHGTILSNKDINLSAPRLENAELFRDIGAPDLVVESVRAEPPIVGTGETFKLYATLKNQGTGRSSATTLRYYSSTNQIISTTDKQLKAAKRDPLPTNGKIERYLTVTAPTEPGTYYYGACVDTVDNESNTSNNCYIDAVSVTVLTLPPLPDLISDKGAILTLPPDLISEVAYGPNSTYFIVTGQFPTLTGVNDPADVIYRKAITMIDLPDDTQHFWFPLERKSGPGLAELSVDVTVTLAAAKVGCKVGAVIGGAVGAIAGGVGAVPGAGIGCAIGTVAAPLIYTVGKHSWKVHEAEKEAEKLLGDPVIELKSDKETPGLPRDDTFRILVLIQKRVPNVKVGVGLEYQLNSEKRWFAPDPTYSLMYEETWNLAASAAAAPGAQPMSLSDYPSFQQLSPEAQEYFLRHFGGVANAEAWQIPEQTSLLSNYPNPFNPETWIPYQLATSADVTLMIYDIKGRVVRDIDLGHQPAGIYQSKSRAAYWDGKNTLGESVASGVYFYTLTAGDFAATRKMLIRK